MKTHKQLIKWKLCKAYFDIIDSSLKEEVTFEELIFVSKIKPIDAEKIISKNNNNYNQEYYKLKSKSSVLDETKSL